MAARQEPGTDYLAEWYTQGGLTLPRQRKSPGLMALPFYGRMSTELYQDPVSSRQWQLSNACELIAGSGWIVAEFFDEGITRRIPWQRRPQASMLLAAIANPQRGFTAVVVGEYERALPHRMTALSPFRRLSR